MRKGRDYQNYIKNRKGLSRGRKGEARGKTKKKGAACGQKKTKQKQKQKWFSRECEFFIWCEKEF